MGAEKIGGFFGGFSPKPMQNGGFFGGFSPKPMQNGWFFGGNCKL